MTGPALPPTVLRAWGAEAAKDFGSSRISVIATKYRGVLQG